MIDTDLIVQTLRARGHEVTHVVSLPDNAGTYEFMIDGNVLNLEQTRELLESETPA